MPKVTEISIKLYTSIEKGCYLLSFLNERQYMNTVIYFEYCQLFSHYFVFTQYFKGTLMQI